MMWMDYHDNQWEKVVARATHLIEIDSIRPSYLNLRALSYFGMNRIDEATDDILLAIKDDITLLTLFVLFEIPDSALPMLADKMKGAMAKDTTNTFYASAMATVYEVKDDYLNAARCYEEFYRRGVDYEINSIYENYFKARKYDKALWWIDEAIKTDSNFTSYEEKSAILLEMGDLEGAISTMDDALHIDPNSTKFHYHKGVYYKFMRRYDEAIQLFTKIITLDKNFTAAWYQRGSLYMLQGKTAEARADLRKVIDKDDIAYYCCSLKGLCVKTCSFLGFLSFSRNSLVRLLYMEV